MSRQGVISSGQKKSIGFKENFFGIDFFKLLGLVFLTFIISYYTPKIIALLFVVFTLILFFRSKNDYFWLAFFLVLYSAPFGLFAESRRGLSNGLPLFSFMPGFSLNYYQAFEIIAILKAIILKRNYTYKLKKEFNVLLAYFGLLLYIAFFFRQTSLSVIIIVIRNLFPYSLIFILPRLIITKKDFYKLVYLLLPFIFFHFIDSVLYLANGGVFYNIGYDRVARYLNETRYIAVGGQFEIVYISFVLAMIIYIKSNYNKFIKISIILMSFFIIIAGAYRSWFVIFVLIFATYLLTTNKKLASIIYSFAFILIISNVLSSNIKFNKALSNNINRIAEVTKIFDNGTATNKETNEKMQLRLPSQIKLIEESPIFGWGFTNHQGDPDVGNFALLVDLGILGFVLYLVLWIKFAAMYIEVIRNKLIPSNYRAMAKVLLASFLGLLISHFTTNGVFGLVSNYPILAPLFVFISDFLMKQARKESRIYLNDQNNKNKWRVCNQLPSNL